jgi:hypothetical protein
VPADPYRTAISAAAPRRKARPLDTTPFSSLPLGIVAITLFLPVTTQDCDHKLESPLDVAAESFRSFVWIAPMFIAAAALCVTIIHTYWKRRPGPSTLATALVAIHVFSVSAMGFVAVAEDGGKKALLWMLMPLPSLAIFTVAWWRRGLRRLSLLVDAHLVAALPLAGLIVTYADVYGGYIFGFAFALLILLRVAQLVSRLISR